MNIFVNKHRHTEEDPIEGEFSPPPIPLPPKRSWKKSLTILLLLVVAFFVLKTVSLFISPSNFPSVNSSAWQAVFLTNDQVYFGHLSNQNAGYVTLTQVFYLRASQSLQQSQSPEAGLNLIKLGGELHGPEDTMHIPKDRILFWEDMKKESQVVQAITKFLTPQTTK